MDLAARRIIRDYMDGKMQFFTPAPHVEGDDEEEMMAQVVGDANEI